MVNVCSGNIYVDSTPQSENQPDCEIEVGLPQVDKHAVQGHRLVRNGVDHKGCEKIPECFVDQVAHVCQEFHMTPHLFPFGCQSVHLGVGISVVGIILARLNIRNGGCHYGDKFECCISQNNNGHEQDVVIILERNSSGNMTKC